MQESTNKLIVILGPTASGKTDLSIDMAKKFNGEIINADSKLFYKGMNIGTAKPKKDKGKKNYLVQGVSHYLIDILEPQKNFSIAEYQNIAKETLKKVQKQGNLPFFVGGSPLYIDSVVYDYQMPKVAPNYKLRKRLETKSLEDLVSELFKLNSDTKESVELKNKRRVIRAIELELMFGEKTKQKKILKKNILILGIKVKREKLYQRINQRVDEMVENGLIKEVKKLVKKYGKEAQAFSGIGYRQIIKCLDGELLEEEAIELIKRDSRRFAKRQMTWFKKDKNIKWIFSKKEAEKSITQFTKV